MVTFVEMRVKLFLVVWTSMGLMHANAQQGNYSFSPTDSLFCPLSFQAYAENIIYVDPQSVDTSYITWRLIENTCPEGWDIQMCDWQTCYTGLPNTSDMSPVPPGGNGNLRLLVNPYDIEGVGLLHFLVYPTGFPDLYQDVYFSFSTPLGTNELRSGIPGCFLSGQRLQYVHLPMGEYDVLNASGQTMARCHVDSPHGEMNLSLSRGAYIITNRRDIAIKFLAQ